MSIYGGEHPASSLHHYQEGFHGPEGRHDGGGHRVQGWSRHRYLRERRGIIVSSELGRHRLRAAGESSYPASWDGIAWEREEYHRIQKTGTARHRLIRPEEASNAKLETGGVKRLGERLELRGRWTSEDGEGRTVLRTFLIEDERRSRWIWRRVIHRRRRDGRSWKRRGREVA